MELGRLREALADAARRVGIAVRTEPFDPNLSDARRPRGGLCKVAGRPILLVDENLSLPDQIATLARALSAVDLEGIFLPPVVRATIGAYAAGGRAPSRGSGKLMPPRRTRPLDDD